MNSSQQAPSSPTHGEGPDAGSRNPFVAIGLFIRQIIAELRKVVVPTRRELIGYSITALAFVFFMIMLLFGLDAVFGWLAQATFSDPDAGL